MAPVPAGHSVRFLKGYDRSAEPGYGVHGMDIAFYFRGEEGAVQFVFSTGWVPHLPRPTDWQMPYRRIQSKGVLDLFPSGVDLGYHSPTPHYEGQDLMQEDCPILGGPCYYDGSGLNAEEVLHTLIYEGGDAVRARLEDYYRRVFHEED